LGLAALVFCEQTEDFFSLVLAAVLFGLGSHFGAIFESLSEEVNFAD
jgi:hypothetical protein